MRINDHAFLIDTIGMPTAHKDAFLITSAMQRCVILVRATGPTCHGPLTEGYDTKGYRIHGKSCDWGPMAGFVLRDPRLNKAGAGKTAFNRAAHHEALVRDHEGQGWRASVTPLELSPARVGWLTARGLINVQARGGRLDGQAAHPTGVHFYYSLIPNPQGRYGVYFDNTRIGQRWIQEKGNAVVHYHAKWGNAYEPMLALTNPPGHRLSAAESYLNAVTGDYDLFAVWAYERGPGGYDASPYGDDHRPLGTVHGSVTPLDRQNVTHAERNFTQGGQGTKLGNITPRIYMLCQVINSMVGRTVLSHSDESARPFLDDVDLPVIAFTPSGAYYGIENIPDFKVFIAACLQEGIRVVLSDAWTQNPTAAKPNRLGTAYDQFVPANGHRIIVPDWYNR